MDNSKFLEAFVGEAEEYLTVLDQGLVLLEQQPENPELMIRLFRAAHTLKGCARMMGFKEIAEKAHLIEDVFGEIKEHKRVFESQAATQVFELLDSIKELMKKVDQPKSEAKDEELPNASGVSTDGGEDSKAEEEVVEKQSSDYLKVPLTRIDDLLNLMGEIVVNKVKSSHKSEQIKKLCKQVRGSQKQLMDIKNLAKDAMGIPDEVLYHQGQVIHASAELKQASEFFGKIHEVELDLSRLSQGLSYLLENAQNEFFHLNPVIEDLQHKMKEIRMLPCSVVFDAFPRLVRDISKDCEKKIELEIIGQSTELDKKVLDAIRPPLVHIIRNAVDHAIEKPQDRVEKGKSETGKISMRALQERGRVIIEIEDDGQGIKLEKVRSKAISNGLIHEQDLNEMTDNQILNLVFEPGFSTAEMITDISGRGVGLDVVRTEIEKLKGMVSIASTADQGTIIRIELPLTIAVAEVIVAEVCGLKWAFPIANTAETKKVFQEDLSTIQNRLMMRYEDRWIPVVDLAMVLGLHSETDQDENKNEERSVLIVRSLHKEAAFLVDKFLGQDEVFLKNLGDHLGLIRGIGGAAVLGDGSVIVILDPLEIIRLSGTGQQVSGIKKQSAAAQKKLILVVEDSLVTRELEKSILENNGYAVITAIDGMDAVEKLVKHKVNAIISDIQMPRMDGFEFCRQIKKTPNLKDIPFVFVTSLSKDDEKRKGLELGAQAYITKKQFDQGNLVDVIERLT